MKKRIFKYTLEITDFQTIELPKGYELLTVKMQNGNACIWCLIDEEAEKEAVNFEVFGTGHEIGYDMGIDRKYIGTYFLDNGLVFHLFEYTGV